MNKMTFSTCALVLGLSFQPAFAADKDDLEKPHAPALPNQTTPSKIDLSTPPTISTNAQRETESLKAEHLSEIHDMRSHYETQLKEKDAAFSQMKSALEQQIQLLKLAHHKLIKSLANRDLAVIVATGILLKAHEFRHFHYPNSDGPDGKGKIE